MANKPLKIDSLELDLQNPRIPPATDRRDAMQKIIHEQGIKLINLAESIATRGLSPMDRFLVLGSPDKEGKYIVLEGNRRLLCAKLMKKSALIPTFDMPDSFKRRLEKAAEDFRTIKIEPIDCFEVATRAEGEDWIRRRHQGQDSGRGIVDWSPIAKARFSGSNPALQAYDFVMEHGDFTDEQKELIAQKFPLSTFDRLLSTPTVRTALGFEINKKKLETELPPEEALKPLKRLVLDLSDPKIINVSGLKKVGQMEDYIAKMKATDKPDLTRKTGKVVLVEKIANTDFKAKAVSHGKKTRTPRPSIRTAVVPKSCKLSITNAKIEKIYNELKILQLSRHVHAIGVLLRVFLEMSVDDYLVNKAGSKLKVMPNKGTHEIDKKLASKVRETIDHMVGNGADTKDFKGVLAGLSDDNHPFSIDTLHAYIHNRFFTPTADNLGTGWDNAQRFFETIWQ
jgi:hypothetical protein